MLSNDYATIKVRFDVGRLLLLNIIFTVIHAKSINSYPCSAYCVQKLRNPSLKQNILLGYSIDIITLSFNRK